MRGYPRLNFDAFDAKAEELRAAGYDVFNPADFYRGRGVDPNNPPIMTPEFVEECMQAVCVEMKGCQAIVHLPGYENSAGSCEEEKLSVFLGLRRLWEFGDPKLICS